MLRIWRYWLQQQPTYNLDKNFITSNCYTCIEINAHTIIQCMVNLENQKQPELFAPNLFDSQPCESMFRQLRSMSTTFSTVVNCSVLEFIYRVKKIQLQSDIIYNDKTELQFPRVFAKSSKFACEMLPTINAIIETVNRAMTDANALMHDVGIIVENFDDCFDWQCHLINKSVNDDPEDYVNNDAEDDINNEHDVSDDNVEGGFNDVEHENQPEDSLIDDVNTLSAITGELELRDHSNKEFELSETSPFTIVNDKSGGSKIVRKSSICWLLTKNRQYFSSDRLQRVKESDINRHFKSTNIESNNVISLLQKRAEIYIGEWVLFSHEDKATIGLILSFAYLCGKTFREREYTLEFAPVENKKKTKTISVLCSWFTYDDDGLLSPNIEKYSFQNISGYKSTIIKSPTLNDKLLHLDENLVNELKAVMQSNFFFI